MREYQPEASIIVVTGYPSIDSALNCLRARTYDYLTKPFQIDHLQRDRDALPGEQGPAAAVGGGAARVAGRRHPRAAQGAGPDAGGDGHSGPSVSLGYLSQIELGKNSASIETLYRISLGLGIKMGDLFQAVQQRF